VFVLVLFALMAVATIKMPKIIAKKVPKPSRGGGTVGLWTPQCGQTSASVLTSALHSRQGLNAIAGP
jgi:hypothetical protein